MGDSRWHSGEVTSLTTDCHQRRLSLLLRTLTRRWRSTLLILTVCVAVVVAGLLVAPWDRGLQPLQLDGTLLKSGNERFVLAGTSAYFLPFYPGADGRSDAALAETTERSYVNRQVILERMADSGVNTLRVPVSQASYGNDVYDLGGRSGYLRRLRELVSVASEKHIRVIIGWWDSHSDGAHWLTNFRKAFPMMHDVRKALRPWPEVMFEPFNEPHDITWEQWEPVMSDVITFWRKQLDYQGVLVLDTKDYSWAFDPDVAQRMLRLDGTLRAGKPAVLFANHRYANNQRCFCGQEQRSWDEEVGQYVGRFPLVGTEYGRWAGPSFTPQPQWNADFARHLSDIAIPGGLNGYLSFVWDWVDQNSMTQPGGERLNAYGDLVQKEIFRPYGRLGPVLR